MSSSAQYRAESDHGVAPLSVAGDRQARAAVLRAPGTGIAIETVTVDDPGPDEVRVRIVASALCHSDLHAIDGLMAMPLPVIVGHEAAGIVEAVGSAVRGIRPGDHVVCCLSQFCGACERCLRGETWLCPNWREQHGHGRATPRVSGHDGALNQFAGLGALAEVALVHSSGVVVIDDDVRFDIAALLGCSVLTGIGAAVNAAQVRPGSSVAVIGCGGVGLNVIQGARLAGAAEIVAIDVHDSKLDLATTFGATRLVNSSRDGAIDDLLAETGPFDYTFDAVGIAQTASTAFRLVKRGSTAYIVGVPPDGVDLAVPGSELVRQAKGIQGVLMGSNRFKVDIPRLVDLHRRGRIELDALISERIALTEVNAAFDRMRTGRSARAVVMFPDAERQPGLGRSNEGHGTP